MNYLKKSFCLFFSLAIGMGASGKEYPHGFEGLFKNSAIAVKRWRSTPYSVTPSLSWELIPSLREEWNYFRLRLDEHEICFYFIGEATTKEVQFPIKSRIGAVVTFVVSLAGPSESGYFERTTEYTLSEENDGGLRLEAQSILRRRSFFWPVKEVDTANYLFMPRTVSAR